MAVIFTATQSLLAAQATALSAEATAAGLSALSTALTALATEISTTNNTITEEEFLGGDTVITSGTPPSVTTTTVSKGSAAVVWTQTLTAAAQIIQAKNSTLIKDDIDAIATDIDTVASNSTTIKDKQTILADKQTAIETYQKKLKELGETTGIRSRGPFETWGNISTYKFLIEQGKILDQENAVSPEKYAQALAAVKTYMDLITEKGKEF